MMLSLKLIPALLLVVATVSIQGAPHGGLPPPPGDAPPPEVMALFTEARAQGMTGEEAAAYVNRKMMEAMGIDPSMLGPPQSKKQKKSDDAPPPEAMALFSEARAQGMSGEEAAAYVNRKMMEAMGIDPSMLGPPQSKKQKKSDDAPPPEAMALFSEARAQGMSGEEAAAYVNRKMMEAMGIDPSMLGPPQSKKQKKSDDAPPPDFMTLIMEAMTQGKSGEEAVAYASQKMALIRQAMAQGMPLEEAIAYAEEKMGMNLSGLGPPMSKQKKSA
ncbi:uncharacterized protein LOC118412827 [Branchiostoma floridae]|uniref:Uncharacterized protein LOC118412827 n=1 Tax=Branchiostoma floridae TaxID=7739 RepID=A0A9J7KY76_BRAFL|nr:uncharacterized protein LOC118412827 [Branchiostoma floridae]